MSSSKKERTGLRILRFIINILVVLIVGIAAFLAWDRFYQYRKHAKCHE